MTQPETRNQKQETRMPSCQYIPFSETGYFSKIVIDYLLQDEKLKPFFEFTPDLNGIQKAINNRKGFDENRQLLVEQLRIQYKDIELDKSQIQNLENLSLDNTYTICTAHQPNIFTGHLYFIYKILHTIKLANFCKKEMPNNNFVPVFYMGSEDADLDELGHVNIFGEKLEWNTKQTGAVGRMKVDKSFLSLIDQMAGMLGVLPHGEELIGIFRQAYKLGSTIQDATLILVDTLFKEFGLLVLMPDNAVLKKPFNPIVKKELLSQFSFPLVEKTTKELEKNYKVQASGREINLFYLIEDIRERIEKVGDKYVITALGLSFTEAEILQEVDEHPERFSANVILRGVFQEMILPNIAFIGGGGELAYWLELKDVFKACEVPFPVLILRNSFVLINEKQNTLISKTGFSIPDIFKPTDTLINELVKRESQLQLELDNERKQATNFYNHLQKVAGAIDATLTKHIEALEKKFQKTLTAVERKMLRAEKKKMDAAQRQIRKWKDQLFPNNSLQERHDNFAEYYATYGKQWLQHLYDASLTHEQQFAILELDS